MTCWANGNAAFAAVKRTRPTTSPGFDETSASAARICASAGPTVSARRFPASVSDTLRVVRAKRTTRRSFSSCATFWLTADRETLGSRAAPLKLRVRATARNACS